jgi:apoptosis-inducing factor 2
VSKYATKNLQNLKVDLKFQTKIMGSAQVSDGRQELILSSGEKVIADMYIPTFGVKPNSSYIPEKFLDANGYAVVDEYLKLKDAGDVWAIGDISATEPPQFMFCDWQSAYAAKTISLILSGKTTPPYKASTKRKLSSCHEI